MQKYTPLIIILILATALTLKSMRYSKPTPPEHNESIDHQISNFLAHHGWTIIHGANKFDQSLLKSLTYRKANCTGQLTIAILTDNTELLTFVKSVLGSDLAIFENQIFVDQQNTSSFRWATSTKGLATHLVKPEKFSLPPLAISPHPPETPSPCAPPAIKHWKNWQY